MGIRAVFAEALPDIFEAAGEDAIYTPVGGPAIPCKIFIEFDVLLQPTGTDTQVWEQGTTIEALLSVLGSEPLRGAEFSYDDITYTVRSVVKNDGLTVKLVVS
ncbi:MAG: hypothetical protein Q8M94_21650, partial [Ignavibacteria bacterium]|nr:hypothetical protein [Ignavibacteria bacterium]